MYILVFFTLSGAAHWGNKSDAIDVKVTMISDQATFDNCVLARCCCDLVDVVTSLRALLWRPERITA